MPRVERPAMADYGIPGDPAGTLPWIWAQERLVRNRNYWVVTVSASGRPHALPVWGVWLPDTDRFWFSCSPHARKLRNIAENPQCVVTVDDTVECVSVEGLARVVHLGDGSDDSDDVRQMIAAYLAKYYADPGVHAQMDGFIRSNAIVTFAPERAFGIIEREQEFAERATRWRWEPGSR